MTFWDIAAGILIAAFFIAAIYKGFTQRDERILGIAASVFAALLILWRATCWHGDIKCDIPLVDTVSLSADHR